MKTTQSTRRYAFNEGDDYWVIESNQVVYSCWDDLSEEYHDENPNTQYFATEADAYRALKEKTETDNN